MAWFSIVFWAALAYLVLPRVHRILTKIYLPDYFIGRARTSDGLLGDPVNLALLGSEDQVHAAMHRVSWTQYDHFDRNSSRRIILSTLTRRSYAEAPVSPLFIFGRQQDSAYQQEVDGSPGKRHHVRFWRCPPGRVPPGAPSGRLARRRHVRPIRSVVAVHPPDHAQDRGEHRRRKRPHPGHPEEGRTRGGSLGHPGFFDRIPCAQWRRRHDFHRRGLAGRRPCARHRCYGRSAPAAEGQPETAHPDALRGRPRVFSRYRCPRPGRLTADRGQSRRGSRTGRAVASRCDCPRGVRRRRDPPGLGCSAGRNLAKIVAMLLSAAAIVTQAVNVLNGGPSVDFRTNLLGLSSDILLIIALTSEHSRTYAKNYRQRKVRRSRVAAV